MTSSMRGGVMRTAASRLVGVGTVISGVGGVIRRLLSIPKLEYQQLAAARWPASAIAASNVGGPAVAEKASWEVGDTEFASLEDDVGFGSSNSLSLPRVVFVGSPTFNEAKEASMELKEAVENSRTLTPENKSLPLVMASEDAEATTCVSSDIASTRVVLKHVELAFRILSENSAAQKVVASIASDPNVRNAICQNTELVKYVESHRTGATSPDIDAHLNQHIGIVELQDLNFSAESENSSASETNEIGTSITEILQTIKLKVMDIVNNVSNFFQDIFGVPETDKKPASFLGATSTDIDADLNQHIGIVKLQDLNFFVESENSSVGSSETNEIGTSIAEILQTIKLTVIYVVNNVSNFFQDIFGVPATDKKPASFLGATSPDIDADLNQHIGIVKLQDLNFFAESENSSVGSSETNEIGTSIAEILQTIKLTVIYIVNNVSNFFQDIFGVPETDKKPSDHASFSKASFMESTSLKASIRGLAIVVISMAVLKRV